MACASRGSLRYTSARALPGVAICHIAPAMEVAAAMMSTASRSDSPGRTVLIAVPIASTCVHHVSRAAIPILRRDGGGLIVQISSIGGRVGNSPGLASYQAAKFAIDGFSRVLRAEAKPFGIRVLVVEPSGFRTDWAGSSMVVRDIPAQYAATIGVMNDVIRRNPAGPPGDPDRAASIIVEVAKRRDIPEHLTLGVVASEMAVAHDQRRLEEDRRWAAVSRSADACELYPVTVRPT
jgi:NAD(P)-dependent dehydrogenase (short-subunit alcohol dehydrogenase family)